ncbi:Protein AIG2 B [Lachnellula cervina]|uniref:Putative gamma-glutamylcyclotransferase n=1 Tax=Lachnellula cervina TaxID=1316786 RepID=A0A7D8YZM9_9HELO|nr:Protein AIG2 B [Lachnellula cervina]
MGDRTAFFYGMSPARPIILNTQLMCPLQMVPKVLYRVCYNDENADQDPVKKLLTSQLTIRPAILRDFCRHRVRGVDYPGIIPQGRHTVQGTFVTGLSDADIFHLDMFEGSEYTRMGVKVELPDGQRDAETYVYTAGDERLEKREWDFEEFCREKLHRWVDDSDEYREVDEAVASSGNDPTGGRGVRKDSSKSGKEEVLKSAV